MMSRPHRVFLLTGIATGCLLLQLPSFRQPPFEDWIDPQTVHGHWIGSGQQAVLSAVLMPPVFPAPRGGAEVSVRDLDRTIQKLWGMVLEDPTDFAARSNLAVLLIERSRRPDHPRDLIDALEHLEYAREAAPDRPEVLFNHALALTRLDLSMAARSAWGRYLETDPGSAWADAARRWAQELRTPTLSQRWERHGKEALRRAAQEGDVHRSASLLATYPTFARPWIEEELLPEWAAGAEAAGRLAMLRVLAPALTEVLHDHTVEDTLARIDGASAATREALLEGLRLYGQAMRIYRAFGPEKEKNALLEGAAQALERAGSPLAGWARFYRAVGWHRASPAIARQQLSDLAARTPAARQPILLAHVEWMLGTNEETQNRYERALEHYERARELRLAAEGPQATAFLHLLIAETLSKLGERDQSWAERRLALQELAPLGDRQRLHATLYSTVEQLFLEHRFAAARPWVEELETNAARWGAAPGLAEAALQKGRLLATQGRTEEAETSFRQARQAAAQIADDSLRRRTVATIDLYQGESQLSTELRTAAQSLARARTGMLALGYRFQLPRIDSARAQVELARGDREAAMAMLRLAIEEEEAIRREVRNESLRASAFDGAQRAFDALVELELAPLDGDGDGDADGDARAFGYAERSRARLLFDLLVDDGSPLAHPVDLDRLMAELPEEVDLLELAVLPQQTVVWWVRRGEVRRHAIEITARELARRVDRLRGAIIRDSSTAVIQERAAELWRLLIGPIAGELLAGRRLVIVPDRFLGRLPFGVLFDPRRQRYLLEDHEITLAPSASAFLVARERRRALGDGPPSSVLAVGANHPDMTRLATVDGEAEAVGGLYPHPRVLTGDMATRAAFLAAIGQAEVLHFAGHAQDDAVAQRRSRLFFRPASPDDPGLLFGEELAAGHFPRTRLAVLAACRSINAGARGRETVSGLAAAFLAAGVPTVVASLWDADDRATADLMIAMHRNLRRGLPPGESLRQAQINMLRPGSRFRSPRHWAGFVAAGAE